MSQFQALNSGPKTGKFFEGFYPKNDPKPENFQIAPEIFISSLIIKFYTIFKMISA